MATDVVAEPRARRFPFRLSEVLEAEFLAIHGYPSARPTWLLEPAHVDVKRLDELLQQPAHSAYPAAIEELRATIERQRTSVPAERASGVPLVDALNAALCLREPLFNHHLIECDSDAWHVAEACLGSRKETQAPPAAVSAGDPHVLMNRLLLEAVFPTKVITRADTVRLNRLFDQIHQLRGADGISSALCLSGGGIRSASFGLGVLQGLARSDLLSKFDYLSTVSGGGYIGSWLSTWIHRHPHGLDGVVAELGAPAAPDAPPGPPANKLRPDPPAVRFLRSYSHFLNPKAGLFSADTWSWVGIYLRNLSLNWLVLIPLMLLVVAVPRLYAALLFTADVGHGEFFPLLFWTASIAVLLTFICVTINRPSLSDPARPETRTVLPVKMSALRRSMQRLSRQGWILALGVAPLTLFTVLATLLVWDFRGAQRLSWAVSMGLLAATPWQEMPRVLPYVGIAQLVLWGELLVFAGWLLSSALIPGRNWKKRAVELGATFLAGLVTWGLIAFVAATMSEIEWTAETSIKLGTVGISLYPAHLFAILAIPVLMLAVLAGMTFSLARCPRSARSRTRIASGGRASAHGC